MRSCWKSAPRVSRNGSLVDKEGETEEMMQFVSSETLVEVWRNKGVHGEGMD